jgi:hypothetical protein
VIIDAFCFKHQIPDESVAMYLKELNRVSKPGTRYMLTLAGDDDGYYGQFLKDSPEPERCVIIDPGNGIASILYNKKKIERLLHPEWRLEKYEHKDKSSEMHGVMYKRSTHVFFFLRQ